MNESQEQEDIKFVKKLSSSAGAHIFIFLPNTFRPH